MKNLRCKKVLRRDGIQEFFRLWRIMWEHGEPGDGGGYSAKFTIGVKKQFFGWEHYSDGYDWLLTIGGLRLHYSRSYAGRFV